MTKKIEKSLEERMEEWKYSDQTDESAIDVAEDIINEPLSENTALKEKLEIARNVIKRAAYKPIGGKTEDYFCSNMLQIELKDFLSRTSPKEAEGE